MNNDSFTEIMNNIFYKRRVLEFYINKRPLSILVLGVFLLLNNAYGKANTKNPDVLSAVFGKLHPFVKADSLPHLSYFEVSKDKGELTIDKIK